MSEKNTYYHLHLILPPLAWSNHLQVDQNRGLYLVSWFDFWNPFRKKHQFGETFTEALPRMPGSADVPRLRLRLRFTGAGDGDGKAEKAGGGVNGGLGGSGGAGRLQWFACFPFGKRHLAEGFFESKMMKMFGNFFGSASLLQLKPISCVSWLKLVVASSH